MTSKDSVSTFISHEVCDAAANHYRHGSDANYNDNYDIFTNMMSTDDDADDDADDDVSADASSYTETVTELKQCCVSVVAAHCNQATLE